MSTVSTVSPAVDLRRAFRSAASSVWVVTSAHDRTPVGFTAISVASVSTDPPLLSFNIGLASSSRTALQRSGRFAVHLLTADQEHVARRFAADARHRFSPPGSWRWDPDGVPEVLGAVARLSGELVSCTPAGDSLVVLGAVTRVSDPDPGLRPLVHVSRTYVAAPVPAAPGPRRSAPAGCRS